MKKNILFVGISVILLILLGIGLSYSMWNMSTSQDTNNVIATTSECFDIKLTNQNNNINLENAYPISNEKGKALTPFTFTIKNTCDMFLSYTVSLESLKGSTLDSRFINVMVNNEAVERLSNYEATDMVNNGSIESRVLAKGSLSKDDSDDYSLRLWIDYDTTMEDLNNETKVLKSKVVIKATPSTWNPVSEGYNTLHDAILANEYQTTPAKALKKIETKGTPDLSKTAPIIKWQEETDNELKTISIIKPASSAIKSDDVTSQLTSDETMIHIFPSKQFDEKTGFYNLSDYSFKDPTTIDYTSNNKYYIMNESIYYDTTRNKLLVSIIYKDKLVYEIQSATKENTTAYWNSKTYEAIKYNLVVKVIRLNQLEADNSDKGLYASTDDYGVSYYYRGNVTNNNIYFAGFNWQIVRINGDESIRLIYNGKEALDNSIGTSTFNSIKNKPAYVGYMYGNQTDTRANSIKNEVSSTVKIMLDSWYESNLSNFTKYLNDSGFCNDRSISSGDGHSTDKYTYYNGYYRYGTTSATLICPDSNDLFTTSTSLIGNKALTYPIGLITADEITFAGLNEGVNNNFYLKSSTLIRTMTPTIYGTISQTADVAIFSPEYGFQSYGVIESLSIRPVINLKPDVEISGGIGTVNKPFIIKTY